MNILTNIICYILFVLGNLNYITCFNSFAKKITKFYIFPYLFIISGYKTGARCERLRSSTQVSALVRKSEYCPVIRFTGLAVICNLSQHLSKNQSINIRLRTFVNLVIFPLSLFSDLGPFGQLMIYQHFEN